MCRFLRTELATDGLQVWRGQHAKPYSCTPLILVLKNLPPALQHEARNVIFASFTKGPLKAGDPQEVLRVVLEEMDLIWTRGIFAYDGAKKAYVLVKAIIRQCCVDAMELPHIKNCHPPTAISGDPYSQDRAIRHSSGRSGHFSAIYRRWLEMTDARRTDPAYGAHVTAGPPAPKTHQWYKDTGAQMDAMLQQLADGLITAADVKRRQKSTGVKGSSAFQLHLSYWDAMHGTDTSGPPEPMHVTKNLCEVLAGQPSNADALLSKTGFIQLAYAGASLNAMAVRLSGVRFPSNASAKPLDVLLSPSVKPYCNSHDWLVWATSGIVPLAMLGNVPRSHFDAFQKLFSAVTIFTSGVAENLHRQGSTLAAAHRDVVDALVELERILWTPMLTSQVRRLVYMARTIAKLGPGPSFWAFFAESLYGTIANNNAQRRNPEVAYAAASMLRGAAASMYAAVVNPTQPPPPKPGLCVDELMQFTSHASEHTLDGDERALLAEAAPDLVDGIMDESDVIVKRFTNAMHAGRISLRAASCDARAATANSGVMFIREDEVCFGHVRCFDAVCGASGAPHGFVLVDTYCASVGCYVPWLLEPLNVPCVPLRPQMEAIYVRVGDICGCFYFCDGDGSGVLTDRGPVRTLHRLVPTHYANLMLKRHPTRRRRLLQTLIGHVTHSAEAPVCAMYSGTWPAAPPPRVLAELELAGSGDDTSDDDDDQDGAADAPAEDDLETGEIFRTAPRKRRDAQALRGMRTRDARREAATAAEAARAAADAAARALRVRELDVGQLQPLKRRNTGVDCLECGRSCGDRGCVRQCCSRSCCRAMLKKVAEGAIAAGGAWGAACGLYGHIWHMPRDGQDQQAEFRPSV